MRYRVLLQDWDFVPGLDWAAWMEHSIQRAAQVVAVLSPDYVTNQRPGAADWWGFWGSDPQGRQRRVLPVRVRECPVDGPFSTMAGVDLAGPSEPDAIERLRQAVVAVSPGRRGPFVPPGFPGGGRAVPQRPGFPGGWGGAGAAGGAVAGGIAGGMSGGFGQGGGGAAAPQGGWPGNAATENAGAGWPGNAATENAGP
nr:toll/interleukin-1 receptor domain-containing protein [Micromonospora sp. DSM 115978]